METVLKSKGASLHIVGPDDPPDKLEKAATQQIESGALAGIAAKIAEPPYDLAALAELYEDNSTNKACVDAKAISIVGLGFEIIWVGEGDAPDDPDTDSDYNRIFDLFSQANDRGRDLIGIMRAVVTDWGSVGNGYLELTRNGANQIDGFAHVAGATMFVLADRTGFVQERGTKKRFFRNAGDTETTFEGSEQEEFTELIHFLSYTPSNTYYGIPPIRTAVRAANGDKWAKKWNNDFFENNTVPRMVIIVEGGDELDDKLIEAIKQYMSHEIREDAHKTMILQVTQPQQENATAPVVKFQPLTVGRPEDAGFLGYLTWNRDEILMVHRVPPSKITIVENANLANSRDQDKTFWEEVILPEQRYFEGLINHFVIRHEKGLNIQNWAINFKEADLTSAREDAEVARIESLAGTLDQNEWRQAQGRDPIEGLDEPLVPRNLAPLSKVLEGSAEPRGFGMTQQQMEGLAKAIVDAGGEVAGVTWEDETEGWSEE